MTPNNDPNNQQPYQQQFQQPYYPQQPQRTGNWVSRLPLWARIAGPVAVVLLAICMCTQLCGSLGQNAANGVASSGSGASNSQQTSQQTSAQPQATAKPKTVLTMSGNGDKSTATFHVDGDWQIDYTCNNTTGIDGAPFAIFVYPKGETQDYNDVIDYSCPKGKSADVSVEHQGGDVYLKVIAATKWTITVTDI